MSENKMFCYQCQETAKGTGCILMGVCGKKPETARWQDLLLSVVRGVGTIQHELTKAGESCAEQVTNFIVDALFSTITNANFDDEAILKKVANGVAIKKVLMDIAHDKGLTLPDYAETKWAGDKADYAAEANRQSILRNANVDLRSLKELTTLGLKGMAAYYEHAARLGKKDQEIVDFMCEALSIITNPNAEMGELLDNVMKTGKYGVNVMALLDAANTEAFGNPEVTSVNIGVGKNPGILISGHDLSDI